MVKVKSKVLSCLFMPDVLCFFRKTEKFGIMGRCFKCKYYLEFEREMEEEEDAFFEELDRLVESEELDG